MRPWILLFSASLLFYVKPAFSQTFYNVCGLSMAKVEDQASNHLYTATNETGINTPFSFSDLKDFSLYPNTLTEQDLRLPLMSSSTNATSGLAEVGRELWCPSNSKISSLTIKAFRHEKFDEALCLNTLYPPPTEYMTPIWQADVISNCKGENHIEPSRAIKITNKNNLFTITGRYGVIYQKQLGKTYSPFTEAIVLKRGEKNNPYNFTTTIYLACHLQRYTGHMPAIWALKNFMAEEYDKTPGLPAKSEHTHAASSNLPKNACADEVLEFN